MKRIIQGLSIILIRSRRRQLGGKRKRGWRLWRSRPSYKQRISLSRRRWKELRELEESNRRRKRRKRKRRRLWWWRCKRRRRRRRKRRRKKRRRRKRRKGRLRICSHDGRRSAMMRWLMSRSRIKRKLTTNSNGNRHSSTICRRTKWKSNWMQCERDFASRI